MDLVVDNGKSIEKPSIAKRVKAKVQGDNEVRITIPIMDMKRIVVDHFWDKSEWLENYKTANMEMDTDHCVITYTKKE